MAGASFLRCGQGRGRTADTTIFSRVLYQLSYLTGTAIQAIVPERRTAGTKPAVRC
jgi:hypothetical protein